MSFIPNYAPLLVFAGLALLVIGVITGVVGLILKPKKRLVPPTPSTYKDEISGYQLIAYKIADALSYISIKKLNQHLGRLLTFKDQIFSSLDQIPRNLFSSLGEALKTVDWSIDLSGFNWSKIDWSKIKRDNLASINLRHQLGYCHFTPRKG